MVEESLIELKNGDVTISELLPFDRRSHSMELLANTSQKQTADVCLFTIVTTLHVRISQRYRLQTGAQYLVYSLYLPVRSPTWKHMYSTLSSLSLLNWGSLSPSRTHLLFDSPYLPVKLPTWLCPHYRCSRFSFSLSAHLLVDSPYLPVKPPTSVKTDENHLLCPRYWCSGFALISAQFSVFALSYSLAYSVLTVRTVIMHEKNIQCTRI